MEERSPPFRWCEMSYFGLQTKLWEFHTWSNLPEIPTAWWETMLPWRGDRHWMWDLFFLPTERSTNEGVTPILLSVSLPMIDDHILIIWWSKQWSQHNQSIQTYPTINWNYSKISHWLFDPLSQLLIVLSQVLICISLVIIASLLTQVICLSKNGGFPKSLAVSLLKTDTVGKSGGIIYGFGYPLVSWKLITMFIDVNPCKPM